MFPFISVTTTQVGDSCETKPHEAPCGWNSRLSLVEELNGWKGCAEQKVATNDDPLGNAATLLKPGNLDVVLRRVESWEPCPLFLYFAGRQLVACAPFQDVGLVLDGGARYPFIGAFIVNPAFHGRGCGTAFMNALRANHRELADGFALYAEPSSIGFWTKRGFHPFTAPPGIVTHLEDVTLMKYTF